MDRYMHTYIHPSIEWVWSPTPLQPPNFMLLAFWSHNLPTGPYLPKYSQPRSTSALPSKIPFFYLCTMYTHIHTTYVLLTCFPHTTNHPPIILPTRHKLYLCTTYVPCMSPTWHFTRPKKDCYRIYLCLSSMYSLYTIHTTVYCQYTPYRLCVT